MRTVRLIAILAGLMVMVVATIPSMAAEESTDNSGQVQVAAGPGSMPSAEANDDITVQMAQWGWAGYGYYPYSGYYPYYGYAPYRYYGYNPYRYYGYGYRPYYTGLGLYRPYYRYW